MNSWIAVRLTALRGGVPRVEVVSVAAAVDSSATLDPKPLPTDPPAAAPIEIVSGGTHHQNLSLEDATKSIASGERDSVQVTTLDAAGPSDPKKPKRKHKSRSKSSRSIESSKKEKSRSDRRLAKEAATRAGEEET
ncbi:UNVERIFIED_CONTAM: hypothetical protein Sangu_2614900 [Sesamum angustifolium]|uniref:Uncharacterized protein n=1 Tax=Sesamum angustifolium TaxID=2727405 RepID=A0AAW2J7B6_9LAMI